jgi:hypothetical protein
VLLEGLVAGGGGVDIRDAAATSLLTEVAQSLQLVARRCGQPYLAYLASNLLPRMGWPGEAVQQLLALVTGGEVRALKDFLKVVLQEIRKQQQQQQQQQQRRQGQREARQHEQQRQQAAAVAAAAVAGGCGGGSLSGPFAPQTALGAVPGA